MAETDADTRTTFLGFTLFVQSQTMSRAFRAFARNYLMVLSELDIGIERQRELRREARVFCSLIKTVLDDPDNQALMQECADTIQAMHTTAAEAMVHIISRYCACMQAAHNYRATKEQ